MKKDIVFATCRSMPAFQPDDVPIARALEARGCTVIASPWNGPFEPFAEADLVVVRSTWDYFETSDAFAEWLHALESVRGEVANSPRLMAWNSNKTYLLDLAERGAPLPPTRLSSPDAASLATAMHELGLTEAIAKPVVGAGASGLAIMRRDDSSSLDRAAAALHCDALVQPLIPEIRTHGETSAMFFHGDFSHAVVKRPKQGCILVQHEHGGHTEPATLTTEQLSVARSVLALLPEPALFARIDMVLTDTKSLLMEVEVIEPELFVLHNQAAPNRFADALLQGC
jgi:glutathione synthase/RimK-type ligase-like ATP-grasp enzyme